MGVLSGDQILELVKSGRLVIEPFDETLVQPASYDLILGSKVLAGPLGPDELGETIELNDKTPSYQVKTGQMVAVISGERLELPLDICSGSFGIRSEYARKGIIAFGGVQLDPGWRGHLVMNLQNVGPEPVTLTLNKPLFTVQFQRLEEPAARGYEGKHQDQDDFPREQYEIIVHAHTTSLAEIPTLRLQVDRLSILIEELKDGLPDPDEGYELRPETEDRLKASLNRSKDELLPADEAWAKFESG